MSHVYEALERAEREVHDRQVGEQVAMLLGAPPVSPQTGGTITLPNDHVQESVLELLHSVEGILETQTGLTLQLVSVNGGAGSSQLCYALCATVAERLKRRTLYWCINHTPAAPLTFPALEREADLRDVVFAGQPLDTALYETGSPNLAILLYTSNHQHDVPGLLESPMFHDTLSTLQHRFEVIVVDPVPVQISADALPLASMVHGSILVLESEKTRWQVANNLKAKLENQGGRVLGAVLNKRIHHIPGLLYRLLL
jgi:Mrp family chromosome partitioning ATPase